MNRTDRLLAIVLELQSKGRQRAEDLAATFETSKRTIYRDIQALSESGVPLLAVPGQGYELMEGYFLPPLSFTTAEASMLLLGSDFVAQNFDAEYRAAAQSASRKLENVLPAELRQEVQELQGTVKFISPATDDPNTVREIRRAIVERRTLQFRYHTRQPEEDSPLESFRQADPYGMVYVNRAWYLVAFCHIRRDVRRFRLDRMEKVSLLAATFKRPPDFKLGKSDFQNQLTMVIKVLFDREVVRWVKETNYFYMVEQAEVPEGLLVTLRVRQEREVLDWLLSWGSHVRVLEPESLCQKLCQEAEQILRNYQKVAALLT
jgi:predicted DNA-binding transcriptional regulator YafY